MWLLPYLGWNIMNALMVMGFTLSYLLLKSEELGGAEYGDFHNFWPIAIVLVLIQMTSAEVVVARYFWHLHFMPKHRLYYFFEDLKRRAQQNDVEATSEDEEEYYEYWSDDSDDEDDDYETLYF